MAKCKRCGAETELYELDVPVCTACVVEREGIHPFVANLSAELNSAREIYRDAMEEFERHQALCRNLPQEHSGQAVSARLRENAKTAGERYWDLLRAYGEALRKEG